MLRIRTEYPTVPRQADRPAGKSVTIGIAALNVNDMRGRH